MLDNLCPASIEVDILLGKMCVACSSSSLHLAPGIPTKDASLTRKSNHVVATTREHLAKSQSLLPSLFPSSPKRPCHRRR